MNKNGEYRIQDTGYRTQATGTFPHLGTTNNSLLPLLLVIVIQLLPSLLFGYTIGGPSIGAKKYRFISSIIYTRDARDIRGLRINSNRVLWRLNMGLPYFIELYGMIGGSDINFPSTDPLYVSGYNGSWEMAYGGGIRVHYLDWLIPRLTPQVVSSYVNLFVFTNSSVDTIAEAGIRNWKVKYRMREYGISAYWSYQWRSFMFYSGAEWTYTEGRVYWEAYTPSYERLYASSSYFNDPGNPPRPIFGVDLILPKNLYLTFELRPWINKENTTFSISFSQAGGFRKKLTAK